MALSIVTLELIIVETLAALEQPLWYSSILLECSTNMKRTNTHHRSSPLYACFLQTLLSFWRESALDLHGPPSIADTMASAPSVANPPSSAPHASGPPPGPPSPQTAQPVPNSITAETAQQLFPAPKLALSTGIFSPRELDARRVDLKPDAFSEELLRQLRDGPWARLATAPDPNMLSRWPQDDLGSYLPGVELFLVRDGDLSDMDTPEALRALSVSYHLAWSFVESSAKASVLSNADLVPQLPVDATVDEKKAKIRGVQRSLLTGRIRSLLKVMADRQLLPPDHTYYSLFESVSPDSAQKQLQRMQDTQGLVHKGQAARNTTTTTSADPVPPAGVAGRQVLIDLAAETTPQAAKTSGAGTGGYEASSATMPGQSLGATNNNPYAFNANVAPPPGHGASNLPPPAGANSYASPSNSTGASTGTALPQSALANLLPHHQRVSSLAPSMLQSVHMMGNVYRLARDFHNPNHLAGEMVASSDLLAQVAHSWLNTIGFDPQTSKKYETEELINSLLCNNKKDYAKALLTPLPRTFSSVHQFCHQILELDKQVTNMFLSHPIEVQSQHSHYLSGVKTYLSRFSLNIAEAFDSGLHTSSSDYLPAKSTLTWKHLAVYAMFSLYYYAMTACPDYLTNLHVGLWTQVKLLVRTPRLYATSALSQTILPETARRRAELVGD